MITDFWLLRRKVQGSIGGVAGSSSAWSRHVANSFRGSSAASPHSTVLYSSNIL